MRLDVLVDRIVKGDHVGIGKADHFLQADQLALDIVKCALNIKCISQTRR